MIKYNSDIGASIVSNLKDASSTVKNEVANKVNSDFEALTKVGLFGTQINNIVLAARSLSESYEEFASIIDKSKESWAAVVDESKQNVTQFNDLVTNEDTKTNTNNRRASTGGSHYSGGNNSNNNGTQKVDKGKEVTTGDVAEVVEKLTPAVTPILLQKLNGLLDGELLSDLLFDESKSDILVAYLKKILGDTSKETEPISLDTESIRRLILEKINDCGLDLTTEEGRLAFKQLIESEINQEISDEEWNKLLYGDNTEVKNIASVEGDWVVPKTKQDVESYASYIEEAGVRQNADVEGYNDKCLGFAHAYAYDLYNGTTTSGPAAASDAYGSNFETYDSDVKQEILTKVYDEVMSGRPVVLQVNGNKEGTRRHFVTVAGFKSGVISGATLKESDLLIIDSYDGKIERMDESTSRFMVSGADCQKEYTGYRIRILKG